jgi:GTP-binding protein
MNGPDGVPFKGRINQVLKFKGLEREIKLMRQLAGDIALINQRYRRFGHWYYRLCTC